MRRPVSPSAATDSLSGMRAFDSRRLAELVTRISAAQPPVGMATRIVAIDGPGGAGKTTLAELLAPALGGAAIVHLDSFATPDRPLDWWPDVIDRVLVPLSRGEPAFAQPSSDTRAQSGEGRVVPPGGCVLVEGVSASRDGFQRFLAFSVWVETPREERLRRGLARDGSQAEQRWLDWMAAEDEYIARERPRERADIVMRGSDG